MSFGEALSDLKQFFGADAVSIDDSDGSTCINVRLERWAKVKPNDATTKAWQILKRNDEVDRLGIMYDPATQVYEFDFYIVEEKKE